MPKRGTFLNGWFAFQLKPRAKRNESINLPLERMSPTKSGLSPPGWTAKELKARRQTQAPAKTAKGSTQILCSDRSVQPGMLAKSGFAAFHPKGNRANTTNTTTAKQEKLKARPSGAPANHPLHPLLSPPPPPAPPPTPVPRECPPPLPRRSAHPAANAPRGRR